VQEKKTAKKVLNKKENTSTQDDPQDVTEQAHTFNLNIFPNHSNTSEESSF